MANKNKIVIITLTIILIICCAVLGIIMSFGDKEENNSSDNLKTFVLDCDSDTIKMGSEVVCSLKGNVTDYDVSAVSATINESNDFELVDVTPSSIWEGDGLNGDIDLYTDTDKKGEFEIVEFTIFLINDEATEIEINISENMFYDQEYMEHKTSDITKKLVVQK